MNHVKLLSDLNQSIYRFKLLDSVSGAFLASDLAQGRDAVSLEAVHELKMNWSMTFKIENEKSIKR